MIPLAGTFDYAGVVPGHVQTSRRWQLRDQSGAESSTSGDSLIHDRLVGLQPSLEITDVGVTPDSRASPYTGNVRPKVFLSRLTLKAGSKDRATVASFSFCVDQALTRSWRAGDVLHIARTGCGGLGLSVVRDTTDYGDRRCDRRLSRRINERPDSLGYDPGSGIYIEATTGSEIRVP